MESKNKAYFYPKIELENYTFNFQDSVVLKQLNNRSEYVPLLINRLKNIPQIIPLKISGKKRNRYDHVFNMTKINESIGLKFFETINLNFYRSINIGIQLHDIGHPPYGHAGERELNLILKNYGHSFSNSKHSVRLLRHYQDNNENKLIKLFNTLPIKGDNFFYPTHESLAPTIVDFIDDIENCFGDLQDLWSITKNPSSYRLFKEIASENSNINDEVVQCCKEYIFSNCKYHSYYDLVFAIKKDHKGIHSRLKSVRNEIRKIIKEEGQIVEHDQIGQNSVRSIFNEIFYQVEKLGYYGVSGVLNAVDIIASSNVK